MADAMLTDAQVVRLKVQTLFSQTMGYVAATTATFALGAYVGRNMAYQTALLWFLASFGCLFGMRATTRRSPGATVPLLLAFGLFMGFAMAPTLAYYATYDGSALWQAGAATALFISGFGAFGYATRRDLSAIARICFFALLGLIIAGIVLIFVHIPGAELAYSIFGLVIFAGLTAFDFQRLRRANNANVESAPLMAASIFLDALNVFMFFLRIFGNGR